ncbi:MAG: hypothetical protein RRY64_05165 [Oscillospiraceae bacterium]
MNGGVVEVKFENDGKRKSVGWRMKPEKAATFESLRQMFQQAEYAYSEENRDANEISSIPQFDYFITNANIEGVDIPVKLQVRNLVKDGENFEKRYYTHNLQNYKKRGSDSPVADTNGIGIDSNAYASSSTPNVAQAAPEVNAEDMQNGANDAPVAPNGPAEDGLGAMDARFPYQQKQSKVGTNTFTGVYADVLDQMETDGGNVSSLFYKARKLLIFSGLRVFTFSKFAVKQDAGTRFFLSTKRFLTFTLTFVLE